ncbi:hypothetical protein RSAG8_10805, partial [Rhizoctonia solani AG-8 WAC10335]
MNTNAPQVAQRAPKKAERKVVSMEDVAANLLALSPQSCLDSPLAPRFA